MEPVVGVLALQGAFAAHAERLRALGCTAREVRTPEDLAAVDALVMPGGESTTMSLLLGVSGLTAPLRACLEADMPVLATCAGLILLAREIRDGRPDQIAFGVLPVAVRRNGYGRQVDSFEAPLDLHDGADPFHGVFIRAPRIEEVDATVEVLATHRGDPVLVRHRRCVAATFHPELTEDDRVHRVFLDLVPHSSTPRKDT